MTWEVRALPHTLRLPPHCAPTRACPLVGALFLTRATAACAWGMRPAGLAGVGMFFTQEATASSNGAAVVKTIVPGGSADRDGTVQPGDYIETVDGADVVGQSLNALRQMILGEVATYVTLGFRRGTSRYEVTLMRGSVEYFAQQRAKTAMFDELDRLRRALVLAEEELERLRKALRVAASQSERDKDDLEQVRAAPSSFARGWARAVVACLGGGGVGVPRHALRDALSGSQTWRDARCRCREMPRNGPWSRG